LALSSGLGEPHIAASVEPILVVLAAGRSTRYGRTKQLDAVGPTGEWLMDYTLFQARQAGFGKAVVVTNDSSRTELESHLAGRHRGWPIALANQGNAGRAKPWGTAHAVLAARELVPNPFAVANADDWYGESALAAMARQLQDTAYDSRDCATVGYRLDRTMSPYGGVSRALVTERDGTVDRVVEHYDVRMDDGSIIGRPAGESRNVRLPPFSWCSMNLWGFTPEIFPILHGAFEDFAPVAGPEDELGITPVINQALKRGEISLRLIPCDERWFGMTHPADRELVMRRLAGLPAIAD